ncbi:hypothetical protein D9756_005349 [Leucocoprinus leucothites]|uniref:DUF1746 domain-containing protein n=1 Tax=Leucocoprinus leucothites TaxID=201217 RepID=A0A8H5FZW6_9AGAR|nr:hypothetical protein D9756_005349 [Leucoagaricus leucothites]
MPTRYYAQRQHLVHSLDSLIRQLSTLSFLLSPSVFIYLSRLLVQLQCVPFDPSHPLRFFYVLILFCNAVALWIHAIQGASEGRALVIDFIGLSYTPSRIQLLSLDLFIAFLQLLIATLAYETQLYYRSTDADALDVLLPEASIPSTPLTSGYSPLAMDFRPSSPSDPDTPETSITKDSRKNPTSCIIDLQFSQVISRLRNPPPPVPQRDESLLPLPNTTALPLPASLRMIMRANARARRERGSANTGGTTRNTGGGGSGGGSGGNGSGGRIPGGLG